MLTKGNSSVMLLDFEVKNEMGIGGGCPYIQGTAYYTDFIKQLEEKKLITITDTEGNCFPAFLIYTALA